MGILIRRNLVVVGLAACLGILASGCGLEAQINELLAAATGALRSSAGNDFVGDDSVGGPDDVGHQHSDDFDGPDGLGKVELKAFLFSESDATRAKVSYEEELMETKFEVEVFGGQPGAMLDVAINDAVVTSITLNGFGNGKIEFHTHPHELNHQPFPADFPEINAGDAVRVGDMVGTLALGM